jgi:hypothetical protein
LAKEGLATWLVSLAELGVEMPWLGMSPWLALLPSDRFTRSISLWCGLRLTLEVGGGLVIQQAHRLDVSCYGWLDYPGLEYDPILCLCVVLALTID